MTIRARLGVIPISGLGAALLLGALVASPHPLHGLLLLGATAVLAATILLPPHLFIGAILVVLGTFSVSEEHPFIAGAITIYTLDIVLVLLLLRAILPRPRHRTPRIISAAVAVPLALWGLISVAAAVRGHSAGNSLGQVGRLETSFVYLLLFGWGFRRVVAETKTELPRVVRAVVVVGLGFILYALYTRVTHQRFAGATGAGVGAVDTAGGVLRRDYGLFSAFEIYPLLALAALAYLTSVARGGKASVLVMCAATAATILTLVRGMIFGAAAAAALLVVWAIRVRPLRGRLGGRLAPAALIFALAASVFAVISPNTAYGVADRMLPGLLPQTANANANTQFRAQVLVAGVHLADQHAFGIGFVTADQMTRDGFPPLYLPHSHWASLLAFEGWPGLLAFVWLTVAVIRRSSQLPVANPWLHRLLVASAVLMFVQGFGWNVLFSMLSGLGMFALVAAVRFGLGSEPARSPRLSAE